MKNTHFLLAKAESDVRKTFLGAFIAYVDGKKSTSIKDFSRADCNRDEVP
jgi:hypothetical protein